MAQQHHDRRIRVRVWERVDGKTDLDVWNIVDDEKRNSNYSDGDNDGDYEIKQKQ